MGSIPSSAFASSRQAASPNASCRWRRREEVLHKRPNGAALPGLPRHRSPHRRSQGCARLGIALPARKNRVAFTAPPTSCRTGEQMVPTAIKSWRDRFEVRAFPFIGKGRPASLHWNT